MAGPFHRRGRGYLPSLSHSAKSPLLLLRVLFLWPLRCRRRRVGVYRLSRLCSTSGSPSRSLGLGADSEEEWQEEGRTRLEEVQAVWEEQEEEEARYSTTTTSSSRAISNYLRPTRLRPFPPPKRSTPFPFPFPSSLKLRSLAPPPITTEFPLQR